MSGSQNRSCCNIIYRLGLNIVMLLTLLLSMLLFAGSFLTTCYADNMETQQVLLRPDNPLWNLLELAGFGLLFCGCLYLYEKIGEKFRRGLLVFTLTFVFGLGILLILFGRTVPAADALSVYNAAAEWILGNTDIIHPTVSYLSYYPQQIGLMAFLEAVAPDLESHRPVRTGLALYQAGLCLSVVWGCLVPISVAAISVAGELQEYLLLLSRLGML